MELLKPLFWLLQFAITIIVSIVGYLSLDTYHRVRNLELRQVQVMTVLKIGPVASAGRPAFDLTASNVPAYLWGGPDSE